MHNNHLCNVIFLEALMSYWATKSENKVFDQRRPKTATQKAGRFKLHLTLVRKILIDLRMKLQGQRHLVMR
jgi:hypothetical protein